MRSNANAAASADRSSHAHRSAQARQAQLRPGHARALLLQSCYKESHARAPALPLLLLDLAALVQVERGKRQVDHHRHRQAQAARRPPRHD